MSQNPKCGTEMKTQENQNSFFYYVLLIIPALAIILIALPLTNQELIEPQVCGICSLFLVGAGFASAIFLRVTRKWMEGLFWTIIILCIVSIILGFLLPGLAGYIKD